MKKRFAEFICEGFENFKIGDVVYCIDNYDFESLILGGEYIVIDTERNNFSDYVKIDGKFAYENNFNKSFMQASRFSQNEERIKIAKKRKIQKRFDL